MSKKIIYPKNFIEAANIILSLNAGNLTYENVKSKDEKYGKYIKPVITKDNKNYALAFLYMNGIELTIFDDKNYGDVTLQASFSSINGEIKVKSGNDELSFKPSKCLLHLNRIILESLARDYPNCKFNGFVQTHAADTQLEDPRIWLNFQCNKLNNTFEGPIQFKKGNKLVKPENQNISTIRNMWTGKAKCFLKIGLSNIFIKKSGKEGSFKLDVIYSKKNNLDVIIVSPIAREIPPEERPENILQKLIAEDTEGTPEGTPEGNDSDNLPSDEN